MNKNATIVFQGFNTHLSTIKRYLPMLKDQGFTAVLTSPLQGIKEKLLPDNKNWFALYQPINYRIGNDLGSRQDLIELTQEAHRLGMEIHVDVVLHHIANAYRNDVSDKVDPAITGLSNLWYDTSFTDIRNYARDYECTHYSLDGLPALNLSNKDLRKLQFSYLQDLKACGVDKFRFDALKHLACEDRYFEEMAEAVGKDFLSNCYGEIIDCVDDHQIKFYKQYMHIGTNDRSNDSYKYLWVYSHDDDKTHDRGADPMYFDNEWRSLISRYPQANFIYYSYNIEKDQAWRSNNIKYINQEVLAHGIS